MKIKYHELQLAKRLLVLQNKGSQKVIREMKDQIRSIAVYRDKNEVERG